MATPKQANELTSYYIKKYEEYYGRTPEVNRVAGRWNWDNILIDLSAKKVKELLDYYFSVPSQYGHDLNNFWYNYHKILAAADISEKDRENRERLMKESEARAKAWKEKLEQRNQSNQQRPEE